MPTASARGFKAYVQLKGRVKARGFQKLQTEKWLHDNLKSIPLSDIP